MLRIGLISDTHGLLRPQAQQFLKGCDRIIHAGDIGNASVLRALEDIAPVTAVRGNIDRGDWARSIPLTQSVNAEGVAIFLLHDFKEWDRHAPADAARVVVCGHSHRARVAQHPGAILVVNPGSAGPRRFKLPVTAGELTLADDGSFSARIVPLVD